MSAVLAPIREIDNETIASCLLDDYWTIAPFAPSDLYRNYLKQEENILRKQESRNSFELRLLNGGRYRTRTSDILGVN
ncbi:MAG: hypothetical protein J6X49_00030, partial [Victivallales bacterium]|nr:hypothetical protein [Victivallales bacterium]